MYLIKLMLIINVISIIFLEILPAAQVRHGAFSMGASNTARHQTTMGQPIVSSYTEQDSRLQDGLWNIRFMEAEFTLSDNWGYLDLEVNLNNISSAYRTSIDSCFWDFGDGFSEGIMLTDSTTCNTSHTYYLPDTTNIVDYYITFKVFDTAGNFDYEPDSVHLVRMVPGFNFSFQGNEDYHPDAIIDFENTSIDPEGIIDTLWWDMGYNGLMASVVKADTGNVFTCSEYTNTDSSQIITCGNCAVDDSSRICWNDDSPIPSPRHKFEQPGDFFVKLMVSDSLNNKEVLDDLAEVKWFEPIFETELNISYDPSNLIQYDENLTSNQGYVPLSVSFSDVSDTVNTYFTSCNWDFGDSTVISFTVNDSVPDCSIDHTYTKYDITNPYSVSLMVLDTNRHKTQLIERHIRVVHPFPGDSVLFVSNDGNDEGSGSLEDPLQTIQAAVLMAEDPERSQLNTIVIEEGIYEENVIVLHPNLHMTSYYSVDSLSDHIDNTIVDGGWKDEWPNDSEEYTSYIQPFVYTSADGISKELSARSVFLFSNELFSGNFDNYNPIEEKQKTQLTGLTVQNGVGTVLTGNWDEDQYADTRRVGGGFLTLGTVANIQKCKVIDNGDSEVTDAGGAGKLPMDNTHIGDPERPHHRLAVDRLNNVKTSPKSYNLELKLFEPVVSSNTTIEKNILLGTEKTLSLNNESTLTSSEKRGYQFNYSNNYFENNYAAIGKTFSFNSDNREFDIILNGSTFDYVYEPEGSSAISNYWLTKDGGYDIHIENCTSIDSVITGEIHVEEGENIDKVLGKVYGGSNTEERNRLDTEIILQGAQYDTSNTTFPLQLVANTTLRGTSELRNEWVELDSKFNSPILLINEISGVEIKNLKVNNGVSIDNGGAIEVVNSSDTKLDKVHISSGRSGKRGGGIYIHNDKETGIRDDDTTFVFSDVDVDDNDSILEGGGIYFSNANIYIDGLVMQDNTCHNAVTQDHGGGIFGEDAGSVVIENSIIHNNNASVGIASGSWGGGIHFENVQAAMRNVQFTANKAMDKAGAIYLKNSDLNMINCTIADNQLTQGNYGSAIHTQKTGFGGHNFLYITNSIIWNNENPFYPNSGSQLSGDLMASIGIDLYIHHSLVEGLDNFTPPEMMAFFQLEMQNYPDLSNLNINPYFSSDSENPYTLAENSPCIDAGTVYYEITDGPDTVVVVDIPETEYSGFAPDMGSVETPEPTTDCTNPDACNYNPNAIDDDGSCLIADACGNCGGDCGADSYGFVSCGESGYNEVVSDCSGICGGEDDSCYGSQPEWTDCPPCYEHTASMTAVVTHSISGEQLGAQGDMLAAFDAEGNVRGVAFQLDIPFGPYQGTKLYEIQLRSDIENDAIIFKYYDASQNRVYPTDNIYKFQINEVLGDVTEPYELLIGNFVNLIKPLNEGWSWFSINIENDMDINNILYSLNPSAGDIIKTPNASAIYYDVIGWFGATLETLNVTEMYQIKLTMQDYLVVPGLPVDPAANTITLIDGWNPIGYTPQYAGSVDSALAEVVLTDGDFLKNRTHTTIYYENYGWFGTLETMYPTEGYMLRVEEASDFVYPNFELDDGLVRERDEKVLPELISDWAVNPYAFEFNGTVTLSIENREDNEGDYVAAFVGEECRGVAERMYFPFGESHIYIMMNYSNVSEGEVLTFKYFDSASGEIVEYREYITFKADMIVGDGFNTVRLSREIYIPEEFGLGRAYPNPFNPVTNITIALPVDSEVNLFVYDLQGRQVEELVQGLKPAGWHSIHWDASDHSSGVYFVKMMTSEFTKTQKLMLIK